MITHSQAPTERASRTARCWRGWAWRTGGLNLHRIRRYDTTSTGPIGPHVAGAAGRGRRALQAAAGGGAQRVGGAARGAGAARAPARSHAASAPATRTCPPRSPRAAPASGGSSRTAGWGPARCAACLVACWGPGSTSRQPRTGMRRGKLAPRCACLMLAFAKASPRRACLT